MELKEGGSGERSRDKVMKMTGPLGPFKKKTGKSVVRLDSSLSNKGRSLKVSIISQREQSLLCRGAELGEATSFLKKVGSGGYRVSGICLGF